MKPTPCEGQLQFQALLRLKNHEACAYEYEALGTTTAKTTSAQSNRGLSEPESNDSSNIWRVSAIKGKSEGYVFQRGAVVAKSLFNYNLQVPTSPEYTTGDCQINNPQAPILQCTLPILPRRACMCRVWTDSTLLDQFDAHVSA